MIVNLAKYMEPHLRTYNFHCTEIKQHLNSEKNYNDNPDSVKNKTKGALPFHNSNNVECLMSEQI